MSYNPHISTLYKSDRNLAKEEILLIYKFKRFKHISVTKDPKELSLTKYKKAITDKGLDFDNFVRKLNMISLYIKDKRCYSQARFTKIHQDSYFVP